CYRDWSSHVCSSDLTPSGSITEFDVPTPNSGPIGITVGPDGNLWFAEYTSGQIGRITNTGVISEFPVPSGAGSAPYEITAGPDEIGRASCRERMSAT